MSLKFSTGFKNKLLDGVGGGALKTIFDDGYIVIYEGTEPAAADDSIGGATPLVIYSDNGAAVGAGNGLDLETAAVNGAISKASAQVWKGTATATDTGTWFRFYLDGDTTALSTTDARIQGSVGGAGADLFVSSTTFTSAVEYSLDLFSLSIPNL